MATMCIPRPDWLDGDSDGQHTCDKCDYKSQNLHHLKQHEDCYHNPNAEMVLYFATDDSIEGRNKLLNLINFEPMDCTGGQCACEDGDLEEFGKQLIEASRKTGHKLCHIYRLADPGLGLEFPLWLVEGGIKAGVYSAYNIPADVRAC